MDEAELTKLLSYDFSKGTEAFCKRLLERCEDVLNADFDSRELSDDQLDLLAAAGNPDLLQTPDNEDSRL